MSDQPETSGMFIPGALQDNAPEGEAKEEASSGDEAMSMSLAGITRGDELPEADLDLESMSGPSKFVNQGTLIVIAFIIIAAGSLYFMRMTQASLEDELPQDIVSDVKVYLERLKNPGTGSQTGTLSTDNMKKLLSITEIVQTFEQDTTEKQVPIEYVKKNPFQLQGSSKTDSAGNPVAKKDDTEIKRDDLIRRLKAETKRYKINSIMAGKRRVAVINGEFYRAGMTLGRFKIKSISSDTVTMTVEDDLLNEEQSVFELKMDDGVDTTGMGSPFKQN